MLHVVAAEQFCARFLSDLISKRDLLSNPACQSAKITANGCASRHCKCLMSAIITKGGRVLYIDDQMPEPMSDFARQLFGWASRCVVQNEVDLNGVSAHLIHSRVLLVCRVLLCNSRLSLVGRSIGGDGAVLGGGSMYSIELDLDRNLVRAELEGFWTSSDFENFIADEHIAVSKLRCPVGKHILLCDLSKLNVVGQDVVPHIIADMNSQGLRDAAWIAIVIQSALLKIQMQRLITRPNMAIFDTALQAEEWLLSESGYGQTAE
jgi:hypothetical protein